MVDLYKKLDKNLYKTGTIKSSAVEITPEQMGSATLMASYNEAGKYINWDNTIGGTNPVTGVSAQNIFASVGDSTQRYIINKRKSYHSDDDNVFEIYADKAANNSRFNYMFLGRKGDETPAEAHIDISAISTIGRFELDHKNSPTVPLWLVLDSGDTTLSGDATWGLGTSGGTRQLMFFKSVTGDTAFNTSTYGGGGMMGFGYITAAGGANAQMYLNTSGIVIGDNIKMWSGYGGYFSIGDASDGLAYVFLENAPTTGNHAVNKTYADGILTSAEEHADGLMPVYSQSSNLIWKAYSTPGSIAKESDSPVKYLQIKTDFSGSITVDWSSGIDYEHTGYTRLYVNGVARTPTRQLVGSGNMTYSTETISIDLGDLIQIYCWSLTGDTAPITMLQDETHAEGQIIAIYGRDSKYTTY